MNTRSVQRALNSIMGQGPHPPTAEGMSNGVHEPAMRIGIEFQADIPFLPKSRSVPGRNSSPQGSGSILIWTPTMDLKDEDLCGYLKVSKEQFQYGMEQALGLLYYHRYNIEKAVEDLPKFCPVKEDWSMEDKVTFEQAFQFHGKNFQRIRTMLPDKPISSLVKYYYLWKRSYSQYSLMDKHSKKNGRRIFVGLPVNNDDADSSRSSSSPSEAVPYSQPTTILLSSKGKQLPKGIHLRTGELVALASDMERVQIKQLDKETLQLKEQIQSSKQVLTNTKVSSEPIEHLRPNEYTRKAGGGGLPTRWSEEEIEVAKEVIRKHGKDYEALASALDSKTLSQCRNFFTNYKRKLNLPRLIAEYEIRHGRKHSRYSRQAGEDMLDNGSPPTSGGKEEGGGRGGVGEIMTGRSILSHMGGYSEEPQVKKMRLTPGGLGYSD